MKTADLLAAAAVIFDRVPGGTVEFHAPTCGCYPPVLRIIEPGGVHVGTVRLSDGSIDWWITFPAPPTPPR